MTNDDDPKYTAYVLGELEATERAAVEAEMKQDPQIAALIVDLRAATQQISAVLAKEPLPVEERVVRISAASEMRKAGLLPEAEFGALFGKYRWGWKTWASVLGAIAGCVLVTSLLLPSVHNAREVARNSSKNELKQIGLATEDGDGVQGTPTATLS